VDFFNNITFGGNRLVRLAIWACCLAPLMTGTMHGQNTVPCTNDVQATPVVGCTPAVIPNAQMPQWPGEAAAQNQAPNRFAPRTVAGTPPPAVPSEFQVTVLTSTGRSLTIFGANMFNTPPSTFAPVDNIPVTPDYVIGPGDELRLQIWGQVNQQGSFVVDRTGSIALPQVGTVHVAGIQFSQLNGFLKSQLGRIYRNFDLNVNLGQLRSIQVFIVGQARQPGSYTISSLSTLLNALFASGGPLPQGSLRDIQVKRGNETVTHFDLYDLLLHGDKSKDIRLQPGDVIYIPDVGPQVAVMGSVSTPAIYELRGEKTFKQVIALAGGTTNIAADTRFRVERVYQHTQRNTIDVDPASGDTTPVQDGDIITVTSILDRFQNTVTLRGNVANPGRYAWHPGMRVSDLIPNRDALITRDYYQKLEQLGQARTDYTGEKRQGSLEVQSTVPGDAVPTHGTGVANSAAAAITSSNNNFKANTDVILNAPDIDWGYAVIERQDATTLTSTLVPFNLGKAVIDKDPSQNLELVSGDVVTIFSQADIRVASAQQTKFVKLEGEFVAAGVYGVLPGETLRQLVARVGGLSPDAYLYASEFTRATVRRLQQQRLQEYADELEGQITATTSAAASAALTPADAAAANASANTARAVVARLRTAQPTGRIVLQLGPNSRGVDALPDIALEDGDRFVIPRAPATVNVQGQVFNANAFIYQNGRRTRYYLHLSGGPDRNADRKRSYILRADGSVVSYQYTNKGQSSFFSGSNFDNQPIFPGDTIIVPPIVKNSDIMRNLVNVASILQGFGVAAAAVEVLK